MALSALYNRYPISKPEMGVLVQLAVAFAYVFVSTATVTTLCLIERSRTGGGLTYPFCRIFLQSIPYSTVDKVTRALMRFPWLGIAAYAKHILFFTHMAHFHPSYFRATSGSGSALLDILAILYCFVPVTCLGMAGYHLLSAAQRQWQIVKVAFEHARTMILRDWPAIKYNICTEVSYLQSICQMVASIVCQKSSELGLTIRCAHVAAYQTLSYALFNAIITSYRRSRSALAAFFHVIQRAALAVQGAATHTASAVRRRLPVFTSVMAFKTFGAACWSSMSILSSNISEDLHIFISSVNEDLEELKSALRLEPPVLEEYFDRIRQNVNSSCVQALNCARQVYMLALCLIDSLVATVCIPLLTVSTSMGPCRILVLTADLAPLVIVALVLKTDITIGSLPVHEAAMACFLIHCVIAGICLLDPAHRFCAYLLSFMAEPEHEPASPKLSPDEISRFKAYLYLNCRLNDGDMDEVREQFEMLDSWLDESFEVTASDEEYVDYQGE